MTPFESLEHKESYFAMVIPTASQAFIGISAKSLSPASEYQMQIPDSRQTETDDINRTQENAILFEDMSNIDSADDDNDDDSNFEYIDIQQSSDSQDDDNTATHTPQLPRENSATLTSSTSHARQQSALPELRLDWVEQSEQRIQNFIAQAKHARGEIESLKESLRKEKATNETLRSQVQNCQNVITEAQDRITDLEEKLRQAQETEQNIVRLLCRSGEGSTNVHQPISNTSGVRANSVSNRNAQPRRQLSAHTQSQDSSHSALSVSVGKRVRGTRESGSIDTVRSGSKFPRQASATDVKSERIHGLYSDSD